MIIRLAPAGAGTKLVFKNEILGPLPEGMREHMKDGMGEGWSGMLNALKRDLER
jgi:uncharacterized protein YndB with AHSA1/START domain